jgi:zinc/manganese transport system permease protein
LDPEVAEARGVPTKALGIIFMLLLALAVAASVQIVGALLVMTLLVTPAAAALRLTASPLLVPILSMVFAVVAVVGGILLALGGGLPISPYVTTLSFAIYLVARVIEKVRGRQVK